MRIDRDPALIAYQAAEECRALVTATAKPAQLGTVEEVRDVTEGLHLAVNQLPQAARQTAAALRALEEQQTVSVAGAGDPGEDVSLALRALLNAEVGLTVARAALREAMASLSRLNDASTVTPDPGATAAP
ncbi:MULTISPECIES: hypothetical protein [unclassified Streptomyces]|uniref:hypothetical protein n=1 Tax=unclassified Streptomyces TaxID=2593676 RepID=UPI000891329E|nr:MULTISPECIES: hypothetical protein [unclassified Streptomyces]PBC72291.1 hypothetical protein BX261_7375 [Streptomyces sp. 2321.6]SDR62291.1 hypothetical protein SAMN05216511_7328 [Streptomyces sp. KS_16]SEE51611.1 hypothetical protein SAMN05428940_7377 [Streptomyces sp. 2133.1]SNC77795.1 hypothetical protein SAMN06272741_7211 [Streptomyces sp. 2114.4]